MRRIFHKCREVTLIKKGDTGNGGEGQKRGGGTDQKEMAN